MFSGLRVSAHALGAPADGCQDAEHAGDDGAIGECGYRIDDTGRACAWDPDERVDGEEDVEARKDEVDVVVEGSLLHVATAGASIGSARELRIEESKVAGRAYLYAGLPKRAKDSHMSADCMTTFVRIPHAPIPEQEAQGYDEQVHDRPA